MNNEKGWLTGWLTRKGVMDAVMGHRITFEELKSNFVKDVEILSQEEFDNHPDVANMGLAWSVHGIAMLHVYDAVEKVKVEEIKEEISVVMRLIKMME
tara:strand:- start:1164 stop:1457 length:294 start_codon:yes stop_codon:yes gene_type:complete